MRTNGNNGNLLYYGDNLDVLWRKIERETVDLCSIDPPFNSNRNYNVLSTKTVYIRRCGLNSEL